MSLAADRVTPSEAVTRSVVMTSARRALRDWNWTSREVTIPTSLPPSASRVCKDRQSQQGLMNMNEHAK
jgi:hypothetical protein